MSDSSDQSAGTEQTPRSTRNNRVLCLSSDTQSRRQGILRLASEYNWFLLFKTAHELTDDWEGDGVLMTQDGLDSARGQSLVRILEARGTPIVLLESVQGDRFPSVSGDNKAIGRLAANHFNTHQLQHAIFFSAAPVHEGHHARLEGFRSRWKGRTLDAWYWAESAKPADLQNWTRLHNWLSARLFLAPKPLAVFTWNDYDARHVLNACLQSRIAIPSEVMILGADNYLDICEHTAIPLSYVQHDLARIGHIGAAMLDRLMSGLELPQRHVYVKPQGIVTRTSTDPVTPHSALVRAALATIDANLTRAFGAAELSRLLQCPRRRLDYLFTTEIGHSVGTEIAARRIERTKHYLRNTKLPIEEVAEKCGFCNRSFMSRCFKNAVGTTPLSWRKKNARKTRKAK